MFIKHGAYGASVTVQIKYGCTPLRGIAKWTSGGRSHAYRAWRRYHSPGGGQDSITSSRTKRATFSCQYACRARRRYDGLKERQFNSIISGVTRRKSGSRRHVYRAWLGCHSPEQAWRNSITCSIAKGTGRAHPNAHQAGCRCQSTGRATMVRLHYIWCQLHHIEPRFKSSSQSDMQNLLTYFLTRADVMVRDKDGRTPLDLALSDQGLAQVALASR